ncbi:MAG: DNA-directed RNA polymerase [Thermoproteota archaeon]|nr:DNA-directed RNA polymerase [Thermoproteota archaeon]
MFAIAHMTDVVRIPPSKLTNSLKSTAIGILKEKYESMVNPELGYVILIIDAETNPVGKVIAGDGATYHKVNFTALTFYPKLHEVVEGEVVEITDFGAFVRIGPTDALLHLSQITDDYLKSDVKQGLILSNQSEKTLRIGSQIRARITAISLGKSASMGKIGITCRQPFLGALDWVEKEIKRAQSGVQGQASSTPKKSSTPSSSNIMTKTKKDKK